MGYNRYFIIHSEAKSGDDATDRWTVKVSIKQDPMLDKWNGTYGINNATAYVKGFEKGNPYEVTKAVLTMANGTVNSRIKFEDKPIQPKEIQGNAANRRNDRAKRQLRPQYKHHSYGIC